MRSSLDKISTQILKYIPFILAFVTPLFFLPFTADFFAFNKFYLITVLASISLVTWCIRNLTRGKLSFTASPSFFPIILLILANVVSSIWLSPIRYLSIFGQTTVFISLGIIFITTTSTQKNQTLVNSIVYGLIASSTLLSIFTILQHFGITQKVFSSDLFANKFLNLTGGIIPALAFTLPIIIATVGMSIVTQNWLIKSAFFATVMIMIVASIINISILFPADKQPVFALLPFNASWSITVDILKNWQTALLGTGPETYLSTFTHLRPAYLNLDKTLWSLRFTESGSYLLTLVTTTGLIGGLAFFLLFFRPLSSTIKHKKQILDEPTSLFLTLVTLSVFISFLILPAGITSLALAFVSLIGLTVSFKILGFHSTKDISVSLSSKNEQIGNYQNISEESNLSVTNTILPWITTVLSITLIALYWFFAVPIYQASVMIKEASDIVKTNAVGSFLKQTNAAKTDPHNPSYVTILSQTYQNIATYYIKKDKPTEEDKKNALDAMQRSVDAGRLAAQLDPFNPNSYENLANIYTSFIGTADGASDYAISHLAQAVALDPTNPRLRLQLGILFFNLGDSDQATKLIGQAIELKPDWDLPYFNMSAIYKTKKDYTRALQYIKAGFSYTDPNSQDYSKIQEEIKSLEKLAPSSSASATPTAK